jgi:hypothetical protein
MYSSTSSTSISSATASSPYRQSLAALKYLSSTAVNFLPPAKRISRLLFNVLITLISSLFLTNFSKEIPGALQKLAENFNVFTGKAQKDAISMMQQNQEALQGFTSDKMTNSLDAELAGLTKVNEMKTALAKTSHLLTEAERQQFEQEIQMVEAASQMVVKEGEKVDIIEKEIAANQRRLA